MGHTSSRYFQNMVHSHAIKKCPLLLEDITIANTIFGPDLRSLKGKTVRTTPSPVEQDYAVFLVSICQMHRHVNLEVDIMYINSLTFLETVSW